MTQPTCALRLHIDPRIVAHGISWGTIAHIKVLREELGLGLSVAKEYVDRIVFGGETVDIPVESLASAARARDRLIALDGLPPKVTVSVLVDGVVVAHLQ